MHNNKTLALSLLTTLLVITGCTQTQTVSNTNDSTTTNSPVNENSNTPVTNTIESDVNTSDWLTYTNEEYGFSFRYPSTSKLVDNQEQDYSTIKFIQDTTVDSTAVADYKSVTVHFAITDLAFTTLTEKIEQSDSSNGVTLAKVGPIQTTTLNGISVYKGLHTTAIGIATDFYYVPLKNNKAIFIFHNGDKNHLNEDVINTLKINN
ncbi:MAG: hypothetical protein A3B74_01280 [Candidatus Kerfeldbacteria bacterium RIFCSPHIGHO2_02_FULL_42_14]|uniref:Lipoprotein n=1 Tax=Candidatus Kerfeldbacteria bacterium RIFCSPHIGHO2_02_FULL_42_14 TaxID=1798540 RepID=A0A1G2AN94_9BACT|nr:MAG: hypothetical protein A3B74_01280 [Candidatus Kerfeldbacteria bacterium RIFCSPHIGHO2_02_FULL_42_14]OGY81136.1 MAG: hypothetical protein A3E60_04745 [Candidatus Kerfeldbacteria bacterium RIFCSPHIGHO2_12_FULL_42_13]OGY84216.1 MAG: hypothetical protein A3I91_05470 [Candidatus Kerfeldbacteria bacterium RIFCSPLOWO2_02_FULL_42_19]